MHVTSHALRSRRREKFARWIIRFSVGLTLVILAWIVLYVLVRGFVSNNEVSYSVTPLMEESVSIGGEHDMKIIVNRSIRVRDLTMENLRTVYTKARRENWGPYSSQDRKVEPFGISPADDFGREASAFIAGAHETLGEYVTLLDSPDEVIRHVAENRAAIGYIPADIKPDTRRVKVVPLRRIVLAVNPEVIRIVDNKQIQNLSEGGLEKILSGEVKNWTSLGGRDLPVRPLIFTETDSDHNGLRKDTGAAMPVADFSDFVSVIGSTPGAVGLCYYDEATEAGLDILEITRREIRPNLTPSYLLEAPARSGRWGGISTIIVNTILLILFTLLFAAPVGVFAAIYLVEYARRPRLVSILRMGTETLAGVPSIIFGLFGNIFFVNMLGMGIGFISSTLTVTMMILPTLIRTAEEALKSVPPSFREGSLALGATRLQTIFKVVLPAAIPGILTGIILGVGRVVGETAVLLYTLGSNYELVRGPSSSARVLSLHLYFLFSEAISFDRAFATGAILICIVLLVNYSTTRLIGRAGRMSGVH